MKRIVSVSLGSSKRDHSVTAQFLGQGFEVSRIGVDGDLDRAEELLRELDGQVDAIGLGGIDMYVYSPTTRYEMKDGVRLRAAVTRTPLVDGSGLKDTLERRTVGYLIERGIFPLRGRKVLMVCGVDRLGLSQALHDAGCDIVFGDLMFSLGLPTPVKDYAQFTKLADELLPKISQSPFDALYPVGAAQDEDPVSRFDRFYQEADIIAGDYHFIRRYMPAALDGKIVITNTTTTHDLLDLEKRGVQWLVTTTPRMEGRTFGTNVVEAALITMLDKPWQEVTRDDYYALADRLLLEPEVECLN